MPSQSWTSIRSAWQDALYGPGGFYRQSSPADHFRTSVHSSTLFARALVTLARRCELARLVDLGAGSGELVRNIHELAPDLALTAVDLRDRPADLPPDIAWSVEMPEAFEGVVVANEVLDVVPCDVVEVDDTGVVRVVEVLPGTGQQRLGVPAAPDQIAWLERWWPIASPGDVAEVGLPRDELWADVCRRMAHGTTVAIDYGHERGARPGRGSLTSYRRGHQLPATFDGSCDVTAHVAMDAVAAAVGGQITSQRRFLQDLGITASRPARALATSDPAGYIRSLAVAGEAAELTATGGLGDFQCVVTHAAPQRL